MRGQKAWECSKPRVAPQNSTLERGDEGQKRSLSRAFIDERSDAFGQPGYDLDPALRQIRLSVASPQSCAVAI
jgi:hypothetical protein